MTFWLYHDKLMMGDGVAGYQSTGSSVMGVSSRERRWAILMLAREHEVAEYEAGEHEMRARCEPMDCA